MGDEYQQILNTFLSKTYEKLRNNKTARKFFEAQAIELLPLLDSYKIGYCAPTLFDTLISTEKEKLEGAELYKEGKLLFSNCLIFPLTAQNRIVNVLGYNVETKQQLFLNQNLREGLYLPTHGLDQRRPLVLTESILDALSLYSVGITNVLPCYGFNGFWAVHEEYLRAHTFPEIYILFGGSIGSKRASASLQRRLECGVLELPDNESVSSYLQNSGQQSLKDVITQKLQKENRLEPTITEENSFIFFQFENRVYRVHGLSKSGLERLKVTIKLYTTENPQNFHIHTVDLYQARGREILLSDGVLALGITHKKMLQELNTIITILEEKRIEEHQHPDQPEPYHMTDKEKEEALSFLKSNNLIGRISQDFQKAGMVGNTNEVMLAYLGSLTRLTDTPLGMLLVSRSGAGKSYLQEMIGSFTPDEKLLRMTRLTGQSLFYQGEKGLQQKLLTIEEDEGMQEAIYSIRTMLSSQRLSLHGLKTDPKTGDLNAYHHTVDAHASVLISTTNLSRFDFETVNRFLVIFLDESESQTRAILEKQQELNGARKIEFQIQRERITKRHQNMQRLLTPITIVNNLGTGLAYPPHILNSRREQKKLTAIIETIALLHQHQREVKESDFFGVKTRYIEVEQSDIDTAIELAGMTLKHSLDELSPLGRKLLMDMDSLVSEKLEMEQKQRWQIQFTRRELKDRNGWSVWHLRQHCKELVEAGLITPRNGKRGQLYSYSIVVDVLPDPPDLIIV